MSHECSANIGARLPSPAGSGKGGQTDGDRGLWYPSSPVPHSETMNCHRKICCPAVPRCPTVLQKPRFQAERRPAICISYVAQASLGLHPEDDLEVSISLSRLGNRYRLPYAPSPITRLVNISVPVGKGKTQAPVSACKCVGKPPGLAESLSIPLAGVLSGIFSRSCAMNTANNSLVFLAITALGVNVTDEEACYQVSFSPTWSKNDLSVDGKDPHFSELVIWTTRTNSPGVEISEGVMASEGVKDMAKTGNPAALQRELQESEKQVGHVVVGTAPIYIGGDSNGTYILVSTGHPFVHLASMIAPSPEWFVYNSTSLVDGAGLIDQKVIQQVGAYDAGTDNGTDFERLDEPQNPPVPIAPLTVPLQNGTADVIYMRVNGGMCEGQQHSDPRDSLSKGSTAHGPGAQVAGFLAVAIVAAALVA